MKLYCTPLSHFSRKVRALLVAYGIDCEYIDVGNVADAEQERFAGNPLMGVPVLVDQDNWLIESDHIAAYIVDKFDPKDKFGFFSKDISDLNVRAVLNGIMTNEVKIVIGKRTGIPIKEYAYFTKADLGIQRALAWLEQSCETFFKDSKSFNAIHLTCAVDHIKYFDTVNLAPYPNLLSIVEELSREEFMVRTSPFVLKPKVS